MIQEKNISNNSNLLTLSALKDNLCELKEKKGIASRKIGTAKKNNEPFSIFLEEVKLLSSEIKNIQSNIKKIISENTTSNMKSEPRKHLVMAPQFTSRTYNDLDNSVCVNASPDMNEWDSYVEKNANASAYHSSSIRLVIESSFNLKCYYLSAEDKNKNIVGVLPLVELKSKLFGHFFVSMPFFNYGGVLADSLKVEEALFLAAQGISNKLNLSHIEYRHCYVNNMPTRNDKISMLLNLPDTEKQLWHDIGSKLRAQIKIPDKNGATFKIGGVELVDDFYKVFSRNMRDLGTPVYCKSLFINMLKYKEKSNIAIVYINSKPVSAGFVLGWRNTLEIPWASTLRSANKYSSNMCLYWGILKFAIGQGYEVFDFGRSSKDSNTYRFKKQWGAKAHSLHWHYLLPDGHSLPQLNPNNPKYKLLIYIWKKLPLPIANFIGPIIVKNLP